MKLFTKLASLLLALMMVLSLGTTAFAATDPETPAPTGVVTVENTVVGETYSIYKLFDVMSRKEETVTGSDGKDKTVYTYSYKVVDAWTDFFTTGAGKQIATLDENGYVDEGTSSGAVDINKVIEEAMKYIAARPAITPVQSKLSTDATTMSFTGLENGYYLMTTTTGTLFSLDTLFNEVTIREKNTAPVPEKYVEEDSVGRYRTENNTVVDDETHYDPIGRNDASIGNTVNFQTVVTVGKGAKNYVIHDKMSAGLTLNSDSIIVTVLPPDVVAGTNGKYTGGSSTTADDYTLEVNPEDGHTFDIVCTPHFLSRLGEGFKIVVDYSAVLNENALIDQGNPNETYVTYGNNSETEHDVTETYTWSFNVFKYTFSDTDTSETGLGGATFSLHVQPGTMDTTQHPAAAQALRFTEDTTNPTSVKTYRYDVNSQVYELETDENGNLRIIGLDEGKYELREIKAPDGYNHLDDPIKFEIRHGGAIYMEGSTDPQVNDTIKVLNRKGSTLPTTGGTGTTMLYVVGGILMAGAVILLITKRRMASGR